jgi:hypothetical protein
VENKFIVTLKTNENGDVIMPLLPDVIDGTGWSLGDKIQFTKTENGSVVMQKFETELVMVETVSMFRMRYVVEVPKGKKEWAGDTVVTGVDTNKKEIVEFSQEHIDENIVSMRVIDRPEYLRMFNEDNAYLSSWSDDKKLSYINKGYHDDNVSVIEEVSDENLS